MKHRPGPYHRHRPLLVLIAMALVAFVLLNRGCRTVLHRGDEPGDVVLKHRVMRLEQLLDTPADSSLVVFDRALVIVNEELVRNLLVAAIPYQGTVGAFVRIALHSADVSFDDGTALVRLDGSAWLGHEETKDPLARITVYCELDVVDLDPEINVLRTRLRVIALDATSVNASILAPVAERLIENLGWLEIESFEGLNY